MTEKRFYYSIYNLNEDDEYYEIIDKEEGYSFNFIQDEGLASQVCSCLNEQQVTINKLKCKMLAKENELLRQMIKERLNELSDENRQLRKQVVEYDMILRQHEFAEKEGFR